MEDFAFKEESIVSSSEVSLGSNLPTVAPPVFQIIHQPLPYTVGPSMVS
jgi:hypothetical protein